MSKLYTTFLSIFCSLSAWGQSNPAPFNLSEGGTYSFAGWPAASGAGTYPANMVFQFSTDPTASGYDPSAPGTADFTCAYNLSGRPRFLGKDANGVSLITTGNPQYDNCGTSGTASSTRYTGSVVLALNTTKRSNIQVNWTAGTVTAGDGNGIASNPRVFALQLQYRLGTSGNFTNVSNAVYPSGTAGSASNLSVILPAATNNQAVVQIRWVYYQTSAGNGGSRPELRLDDVTVGSAALPVKYLNFQAKSAGANLVAVTWETVSETNNLRFEVERSTDAVTYAALGRVAGRGTTTTRQQYAFTDEAPAPGWNYYRLRQTDTDGTASLSRPTAVLNENALDAGLVLAPNPAGARVRLGLANGEKAEQAAVINLAGQRVNVPMPTPETLDVSSLPSALYLLEVRTSAGRVLRQRLVKE